MLGLILTNVLRAVSRPLAVVLLVGGTMTVDWHSVFLGPAYGQVGPSDCVALCGKGGGGGGARASSFGGGCAFSGPNNAGAGRTTASSLVAFGNDAYDLKDYARAASLFENALDYVPGHQVARVWLGTTLYRLGIDASIAGNNDSAYLYYERANETDPDQIIRDSIRNVRRYSTIQDEASKNCNVCGQAMINDTAFGLNNSASLWHYVNQASINYRNCTRRLTDFCEFTPGRSFFDKVVACRDNNPSNENYLRGCVRQALA